MKQLLSRYRRQRPVRFLLMFLGALAAFYAFLFWLFMLIFEGKAVGPISALFWTISRLTTTGDSTPALEYRSVSLQILSVTAQVSGLVFFFAAFPLVIIPRLEQRLRVVRTTVDKDISGHVVICGYNPLVESLIDELASGQLPFVIVDHDEQAIRRLLDGGISSVYGDPTEEEVLRLARVEQASIVVANEETTEANALVVLAAASLSNARIIVLLDDLSRARYFEYAGADTVLSPKELLGTYLAKKAVTSLKDELFGENEVAAGLDVVELPVYPGSPVEGQTLAEAKIAARTGASVVGIWHRGKLELEPGPASQVSAENVLVAVGSRQQLLELQKLTRSMPIQGVTGHFVIAGYGDVGRVVAEELRLQNIPTVIIDPLDRPGDYIKGDASDEPVLRKAGLAEASTLIVASHLDNENIFVTLVARRLNPGLHILARANHFQSIDKLYRAGADFVFSLSAVAAQMLAGMIQGDKLITLAEGLKVSTITVEGGLANKTVGQLRVRSRTGCTIVALQADHRLVANPGPGALLSKGARLVVLGSRRQIEEFKRVFRIG